MHAHPCDPKYMKAPHRLHLQTCLRKGKQDTYSAQQSMVCMPGQHSLYNLGAHLRVASFAKFWRSISSSLYARDMLGPGMPCLFALSLWNLFCSASLYCSAEVFASDLSSKFSSLQIQVYQKAILQQPPVDRHEDSHCHQAAMFEALCAWYITT